MLLDIDFRPIIAVTLIIIAAITIGIWEGAWYLIDTFSIVKDK